MKQTILLLAAFCFVSPAIFAQQELPYKTLSPEDVIGIYNRHDDYIFLDVRSRGEFHDTLQYNSGNIGHIKGAINIPVQELDKRIGELRQYQGRKLLVYCSHSYRSRVASKMLVDSGFTHVYNMNSGLSGYYAMDDRVDAYAPGMIDRATGYTHISAGTLHKMLASGKEIHLIEMLPQDLQPWDSSDLVLYNAMGSFIQAKKYTRNELKEAATQMEAWKNEPIVVYATMPLLSSGAATMLASRGFKQVYALVNGTLAWYNYMSEHGGDKLNEEIKPYRFTDNNKFRIISAKQACVMASGGNALVLDIRTTKGYNDTTEGQIYSYTHLAGSINVPAKELKGRIGELKKHKAKDLLVVGEEDESANMDALQYLAAQGYKVNYIPSGLRYWEWFNNNDATFKCGKMLHLVSKPIN